MPDETDILEIEEQTLIVPGVLCVSPMASGAIAIAGANASASASASKKRIWIGPSAGWMLPRGIMKWERELSFVRRADATADFLTALRGTLPHEQIAPKKYVMASQAAMASPLIPVATSLVAEARGQGVRVYTVGVDRVSAGFYYFAEGGAAEPVRWQGNLVEMLAPGLKTNATNAEIEALLDGLIERLLLTFSDGSFSELDVELADALPRLARDGSGLQGANLDAFDASARRLALQSAPWEGPARKIAEAVAGAGSTSSDGIRVPLYGEARREVRAALDVHFGGKTLRLADQPLWFVTGQPKEEEAPALKEVAAPAQVVVSAPVVAPVVASAPALAATASVASPARPATVSTGTLTGVAAPVVSGPPVPAVVSAPAPAVVRAAARMPAAPQTPAAPPVAALPVAAPTPAAPPVVAAAPVASAPAKTEAFEAPVPALAPAPATLAGPASELPAPEPAAPERPAADASAPSAPAPEPMAAAARPEAPAAASVDEPPSPEAAASSEPEGSTAIVPAGDERIVPAARNKNALAKRRPFPYSTLLLVAALVFFVLRRLHIIP